MCIGAFEAYARLMGAELHKHSHTTEALPLHLENQRQVVFHQHQVENAVVDLLPSKLEAFFTLNSQTQTDLLYQQVVEEYTWKSGNGQAFWQRRARSARGHTLGRVYAPDPIRQPELFALRLLLMHVRGPTSFQSLKIVNGVQYRTFKEAAIAMGLLETNDEWLHCMEEASVWQMPSQLRQLFVSILCFGEPTDALGIWEAYKDCMIEDYLRTEARPVALLRAYQVIDSELRLQGKSLSQDFHIPSPIPLEMNLLANVPVDNPLMEAIRGQQMFATLTEEQALVVQTVLGGGRSSCALCGWPWGDWEDLPLSNPDSYPERPLNALHCCRSHWHCCQPPSRRDDYSRPV